MSAPAGTPAVFVTCEHAGNEVPDAWAALFRGRDDLLASHRGWDPGAREVATALARMLEAPLRLHPVTRLLVDANRSPGHPRLFGPEARGLPPAERERILERCYRPHREGVEAEVGELVGRGGRAVHLSVHTFTPVLESRVRTTGVGLLYDPSRDEELELAEAWQRRLGAALPELRVHRNRPYRGTSDGLTTWLRRRFPPRAYQGIEVEVRSDLVHGPEGRPDRMGRILAAGVLEALERG